jgi:hypothetical protein
METRRPRRLGLVWVTVSALIFLGVTALGGGVEMLLYPKGNEFVPGEWLDHIPLVGSWIVPGLVLGVVFGIGGLVTATGVFQRLHWLPGVESATGYQWSWMATLLVGFGLLVWITLELIFVPERSIIEILYAVIGLSLVGLASTREVRTYLVIAEHTA